MNTHRLRATTRRRGTAALLCAAALTLPGCGIFFGGGSPAPAAPSGRRATLALSTTEQAKVHVSTAEQALKDGDRERALAEFTKAIEINPNLETAHMGIGDIYRSIDHDYAKAEPEYARAAAINPNNFDAQFQDGLMLHLLDRITDAITAYARALKLRPDDFQTTLNLSAAYYQIEDNTQALIYGRRAVELKPGDGAARFNLGAIYAAMDRHKEAVKEYQQATELMELTPQLLMNLAESLGRLQRFEEMKNTLEQLVKKEESAAAYERLGFARFGLRQYDEAMTAFEKSLAIDPDYIAALNGAGVICMNRYLLSDQKDLAAKNKAVAYWRHSLQVNDKQQKIIDLLTSYGTP